MLPGYRASQANLGLKWQFSAYISQSYISPLSPHWVIWSSPYHPPTQTSWAAKLVILPEYPIKTSWLEARVVTAGKGGEGGKVLDNLKQKNWSILGRLQAGAPATNLTDTEGRTYRQDHENTQSKYSTLKFIVRLITNSKYRELFK